VELRDLRSFIAAARLRSVSKAAEHFGVGQSAVTTHIKSLEQELGTALFDRARRPISLTPSGAALARLATPLVEGIDGLAASMSTAEEQSELALASTHDMVPHTLLRVIRVFLRMNPHAHIRIRSGLMSEVLDMVAGGDVELGFTPYPGRSANLDFMGVFAFDRVLITPPGHPLLDQPLTSLEPIAKWPLILSGQQTRTRVLLETEFRRKGLEYEILVELDSTEVIKRYVALGMGVSVGPSFVIEPEDRERLGVASLRNLLPVEQAGVVTLLGKTLSTPARSFISVMRDALSASASATSA
jgi:DNA-binding transcriptional LysR family regulator